MPIDVSQSKVTSDSLSRYFPLHRGTIRPGSDRLQKLFGRFFSHPVFDIPLVLVAGTNGKGTVCAMLESCLRHAGLKTGLYTSPHLVRSTERIRIAGKCVSEKVLEEALLEVEVLKEQNLPDATFFEIATAAAFVIFSKLELELDVIVCEVGLGGRFDSTNALKPLVSVLTSVGLDHQELLGNTLDKIAFDKSFVSRRNRVFVCGPLESDAGLGRDRAVNVTGAVCVTSAEPMEARWQAIESTILENKNAWLRLNRAHIRTAIVALKHLEPELGAHLDDAKVIGGFFATRWPGRFDLRHVNNITYLFDAAHNSDGVAHFIRQLESSHLIQKKFAVVFGAFADKDWHDSLPKLAPIASSIQFAGVDSERACSSRQLLDFWSSNIDSGVPSYAASSVEEALVLAKQYAKANDAYVLVLGSIALIGAAMSLLKIEPFDEGAR